LDRVFPWLCLAIAAFFGFTLLKAAGFPPINAKDHWLLLAMFVLFVLIPFVKEIDLFQLVSIKRDIKEVKEDVGDAKEKVADLRHDMRQMLSAQQTLMSNVQTMAVSSQRNETHVHYDSPTPNQVEIAEKAVESVPPTVIEFPTEARLKHARDLAAENAEAKADAVEKIKTHYPELNPDEIDEAISELTSDSVAVLRMKVEKEMKNFAKKVGYPQAYPINRAHLVRFLVENNHLKGSGLESLEDAVNVFFRIANGVVHGEKVPLVDMEHAKYLGERLITIFTEND
jgi:hypothetical protein